MLQATRRLGALALFAVGAVHLQQYLSEYRLIPTIGTLFLLNAVGSFIVGLLLLAPVERFAPRFAPGFARGHGGDVAVGLLALGAVAIAVGALISIFIAENGTLFGFTEAGYYSTPIVVAIVAEAVTTVLLAPVAAIKLVGAAGPGDRAGQPLTSR
jgi:hypothetical protein